MFTSSLAKIQYAVNDDEPEVTADDLLQDLIMFEREYPRWLAELPVKDEEMMSEFQVGDRVYVKPEQVYSRIVSIRLHADGDRIYSVFGITPGEFSVDELEAQSADDITPAGVTALEAAGETAANGVDFPEDQEAFLSLTPTQQLGVLARKFCPELMGGDYYAQALYNRLAELTPQIEENDKLVARVEALEAENAKLRAREVKLEADKAIEWARAENAEKTLRVTTSEITELHKAFAVVLEQRNQVFRALIPFASLVDVDEDGRKYVDNAHMAMKEILFVAFEAVATIEVE